MKRRRAPITKETLRQILTEVPTFEWSDEELSELVDPQQGVITGFQGILEDIRKLAEVDLNSIEPAGEVMGKRKNDGR